MRFDLVSIFPDMLRAALACGVIGRAQARGLLDARVHDLRDFADPPHRNVDDDPFGGGAGMVYRPAPLVRAAEALRRTGQRAVVVLPSPAGEPLGESLVQELGSYQQLVILCDRYEGSDARVADVVHYEISIGDYVLTGGELPALVLVDAVGRKLPGVVGRADSVANESFAAGLLDHASYTRPARFRGRDVPAVLTSGAHGDVGEWRRTSAIQRTLERRPDLLAAGLPASEACERVARERRYFD